MLEKTRSSSLLGCKSFTGKALVGRRPGGRIVEGLDVVGKLLRQDRGTRTASGETGGEGGGVGDCCDGMGLGCRGQDWCDGRGAYIAIPGGWTRAPLGGGVPMSISPKDALKSVVTRTMDSFCKFCEHRDNANGYVLTVVGRENPANQIFSPQTA